VAEGWLLVPQLENCYAATAAFLAKSFRFVTQLFPPMVVGQFGFFCKTFVEPVVCPPEWTCKLCVKVIFI